MVKYVGETVLNEPTTHISDSFAPLLGDVEGLADAVNFLYR